MATMAKGQMNVTSRLYGETEVLISTPCELIIPHQAAADVFKQFNVVLRTKCLLSTSLNLIV